jgi:hypothetical protein
MIIHLRRGSGATGEHDLSTASLRHEHDAEGENLNLCSSVAKMILAARGLQPFDLSTM